MKAPETELITNPGDFAFPKLNFDELGTGNGFIMLVLERRDPLLGPDIEHVRGVAPGGLPIQAETDPTVAARAEL